MSLTHLDEKGRAKMVDVGHKEETARKAVATGHVLMKPETLQLAMEGKAEKGDVFQTARLAGIMAAKKTPELIPLCHPVALTSVCVDITRGKTNDRLEISATAQSFGRTGVEMEALTAVAAAALTIYDMLKAVDKGMVISGISLMEKTGGKSGRYIRKNAPPL
jgi:cyclic pyranopterin phosphate synthase